MNSGPVSTSLDPRELAFLQRFFDNVCAQQGLPEGSMAAKNLASELIALYQSGVRDESGLHRQLEHKRLGRN